MADTVTVLAAADADPERVRLEAIRQAAVRGGHILGDPDVQTTGTIHADGETIVLDGSGLALYTWPLALSFVGLHNVAPTLLPPRVL